MGKKKKNSIDKENPIIWWQTAPWAPVQANFDLGMSKQIVTSSLFFFYISGVLHYNNRLINEIVYYTIWDPLIKFQISTLDRFKL